MENLWVFFTLPGVLIWFIVFVLPWRPWQTKESFDAEKQCSAYDDLSNVTVLIPARNEEENIARVLLSVFEQGKGIKVVLVDDMSTDNTLKEVRSTGYESLKIIPGEPLAEGWSGKLWALEQGRKAVTTCFTLLLDADIELVPGTVKCMLEKIHKNSLSFMSLMAWLRMESWWEKVLMPAFIYFFKLLYPFRLSNSSSSSIAAGAGGCILLKTEIIERMGGFSAIKSELIDDCALAQRIKMSGCKTWTGITHSVKSLRRYDSLGSVWKMVSRTAYTQLKYSPLLLSLCVVVMVFAFVFPVAGLASGGILSKIFSAAALFFMFLCYIPTLLYYRLSLFYAVLMPLVGVLFLAMTLSSAFDYYRGERSQWKGRVYGR